MRLPAVRPAFRPSVVAAGGDVQHPAQAPHLVNPKRKRLDDVIEETDCVLLGMPGVDPQRADTRDIVDGGVLVEPGRSPVRANQLEKRDVHLHVMPRHLLRVAMRLHGATLNLPGTGVDDPGELWAFRGKLGCTGASSCDGR